MIDKFTTMNDVHELIWSDVVTSVVNDIARFYDLILDTGFIASSTV